MQYIQKIFSIINSLTFISLFLKLFDYLDKVYFDSPKQTLRADRRKGIKDEEDRYINFFTVGPMKEDARRVTGRRIQCIICT